MADLPDSKPFILPLPDGRMLSLPLARIRPTLLALLELWSTGGIDSESGKIGFSRLHAAELAELEARTGLTWRGGEALRDLGRLLREAGGIPQATLPATFQRDAAAVSGAGRELAAIPRHGRTGWRAGRRHGPGQDRADAGASGDRKSRRADGSPLPDRLPDQPDPQLDQRGTAFCP